MGSGTGFEMVRLPSSVSISQSCRVQFRILETATNTLASILTREVNCVRWTAKGGKRMEICEQCSKCRVMLYLAPDADVFQKLLLVWATFSHLFDYFIVWGYSFVV